MSLISRSKRAGGVLLVTAVAYSLLSTSFVSANAIEAASPVAAGPVAAAFPAPSTFAAEECAGSTDTQPTENTGFAVPDLLQVFGVRLSSYNAGSIVPLYDSYGGSILIAEGVDPVVDGVNPDNAAYPPICGVRYVATADGGGPVSEWMFCTDRASQSCGDTDAAGNTVSHDGLPVAPMMGLPENPVTGTTANPKLTPDQEKIIAYLVQHGHSYVGTGDQAWGGVTEARSDLDTMARAALQTLVWCVSDPTTGASDFATTCEDNMDAAEQARILTRVPDAPAIVLTLDSSGGALLAGGTARFELSTNVFDQPIDISTGGTATTTWTVCSGAATLLGSTLTVSGTNPNVPEVVALCGVSESPGTVTLDVSATPAATSHIGWAQSVNSRLGDEPCQVYATFHAAQQSGVGAGATARFVAGGTKPTAPIRVDTGVAN